MSLFVLDSSVAASWFLVDETSERSAAWLQRASDFGAAVPGHWIAEVTNVALQGIRRGRLDDASLAAGLETLSALSIAVEPTEIVRVWQVGLGLARQHQLTVYDALYLELAWRRGLPLATFDADLATAAAAQGVALA